MVQTLDLSRLTFHECQRLDGKPVRVRFTPGNQSGDLNTGEAKTFTLDLEPGNYVLMCNQTGHYLLGMHIPFVVK